MSTDVEGAIFAPDRAAMGSRGVPLSTERDVAVGFSRFLA